MSNSAAGLGLASPTLSSTANAAAQAAVAAKAGSATGSSTSGTNALASLSSNYQDFLKLLMTQLKNQDPTSPMDPNSFTQELVQFSSVEQQINTNTSLGQLIQLTQNDGIIQSSAMVGRTISVTSKTMPLQNGTGQISFTAPAAENATVSITDSAGKNVGSVAIQAKAGANTWTWNGTDANGNQLPDGLYTVAVTGTDAAGASKALPFQVVGKATGVQVSGTALNLQMGSLTTSFSNVTSVLN
jgi:flagellar basal-body rod modification protein FlgD